MALVPDGEMIALLWCVIWPGSHLGTNWVEALWIVSSQKDLPVQLLVKFWTWTPKSIDLALYDLILQVAALQLDTCHVMKSMQCNSPSCAEMALIPRANLCSSQLWARLSIPGSLGANGVWMQQTVVGEGETEVYVCRKPLHGLSVSVSLLSLELVNVTTVTCLGCSAVIHVEGGAIWVIVTSSARGDLVLLAWPHTITLPRVSDSPSW